VDGGYFVKEPGNKKGEEGRRVEAQTITVLDPDWPS